MRPGQNNNNNNNKRMRGRPTNGRRGPNPLTRSYESNGPDVKIRGNAHHVAEKYLQLARDAHTSGDPVAAENYLQHAEHYFRLIASAQAAQLQAQLGGRPPGEVDYDDDDEDDVLADRFASPSERVPPPPPLPPYAAPQPQYAPQPQFAPQPTLAVAPQPYVPNDRQPFDGERPERPQQQERGNFRNDRQQGRNPNRGDRPFNDRQEGRGADNRNREFRPYREPNIPRPEPQPIIEGPAALPSFITSAPRLIPPIEESQPPMPAPVAIESAPQPLQQPVSQTQPELPMPDATEAAPQPQMTGLEEAAAGEARFPRGRRRRLRSPYGFHAAGHPDEGQPPDVSPVETPASE